MAHDRADSAKPDPLFFSFQAAVAGRYSLARELGRGGMGIVYLAHEVGLDRPVAIKLLPPTLGAHSALRERFLREARTAARLSHPHIVPIYAVDEVGRFVYYAMAYVEGATLAQRIAARGPLPPAEAGRILREVAWALAYAHEKGVVHRDVKPENILLEASTGRALVVDFGIAHLAHASGKSGAGEVLGTPEFMSPEQASGAQVDARSDLYSLGAVGYYALSGRPPFSGPTAAAVMVKHVTQAAPALAEAAPGVPRRLRHALTRCMAKDPAARFESGQALAEAITLAIDQGVRLPAEVRRFLMESESRSALRVFPQLMVAGVGVWIVLDLTLSPVFTPAPAGIAMALTALRLSFLAGSVLGPLGLTLHRLRRLARAGHGHADLVHALEIEARERQEELRGDHRPGRGVWWRVWLGAAGIFGAAGSLALLDVAPLDPVVYGLLFATSGAVTLLGSGAAWRSRVRDGGRVRFWKGWAGRALTRFAALGLRWATAAESVHRPTEMGLALAVDELFRTLPQPARAALAELPTAVRGLEADARELRRRVDDLSEMVVQADAGPLPEAAAGRRAAVVSDLEGARRREQQRLESVVAALETIRLDLLRLRVGAGTVESVTADLEAAREVSREIERQLAGRAEVERLLS